MNQHEKPPRHRWRAAVIPWCSESFSAHMFPQRSDRLSWRFEHKGKWWLADNMKGVFYLKGRKQLQKQCRWAHTSVWLRLEQWALNPTQCFSRWKCVFSTMSEILNHLQIQGLAEKWQAKKRQLWKIWGPVHRQMLYISESLSQGLKYKHFRCQIVCFCPEILLELKLSPGRNEQPCRDLGLIPRKVTSLHELNKKRVMGPAHAFRPQQADKINRLSNSSITWSRRKQKLPILDRGNLTLHQRQLLTNDLPRESLWSLRCCCFLLLIDLELH